MRSRLLLLAPIVPAALFACSSSNAPPPAPNAWACAHASVPNGDAVECTAQSSSALSSYECTTGDPTCPPVDTDAGAPPTCGDCVPGDDGGTDGAPVGQGGAEAGTPGDDYDGGCDEAGMTGDSGDVGGGSSSGSSSGGKGNGGGNGSSSSSGGHGNGSSSGGNGNGNGNSSSSSGGASSGSSGGDYDAGCVYGPTPPTIESKWQCTPDGDYVTCTQPPTCEPGSHPSACGACIPDGTCDDCVPPASGGCWVTGGGFIAETSGGQDSFGGNAMPMKSGSIRGEWENVDHATGNKAHGEAEYLVCRHVNEPGPGQPSGPSHNFDVNQVYFGGPARWFTGGTWTDGYWFDVMAKDHGEGKGKNAGGPDYYHLTIRQMTGASASGIVVYDQENELGGGNIQIHPPNDGHPYTASQLPPWVSFQP